MNYFEIFNKTMLELNYREIQTFSGIYKSEHIKILQSINRVNDDILSSYDWCFLDENTKIILPAGTCSVDFEEAAGVNSKIKCIYEGKQKITFNPRFEEFFIGSAPANTYGYYNNKLLFAKSNKEREFSIFYSSSRFARAADGTPKNSLSAEDDYSILPMPYAEQILVYGTCLKVKAIPSYPKFGFWNTMYIQALGNLRIKSSPTKEDEPYLNINGQSARHC